MSHYIISRHIGDACIALFPPAQKLGIALKMTFLSRFIANRWEKSIAWGRMHRRAGIAHGPVVSFPGVSRRCGLFWVGSGGLPIAGL